MQSGELSVGQAHLLGLAVDCCTATSSLETQLLARAFLVLRRAIDDQDIGLIGFPDLETIRGLLAAGARESAAIHMLGSGCGYMLSRSAEGHAIATVCLPYREEITTEAATPALALIAALCNGLAQADDFVPESQIEVRARLN